MPLCRSTALAVALLLGAAGWLWNGTSPLPVPKSASAVPAPQGSPSTGTATTADTAPDATPVWALPLATLRQRSGPTADLRVQRNEALASGDLGRWVDPSGMERRFLPGVVLLGFRGGRGCGALTVPKGAEVETVSRLRARGDIALAELDILQTRQGNVPDPLLPQQWHHPVLGSDAAWQLPTETSSIRVAIVDAPFQMDHPDLAANVDPGWSVVTAQPITSSEGIEHSTFGAGLAAAVIGNGIGGAGMARCRILPVHINGFTSEMQDAILWCATNGVRVVNISWTGADSDVLEEAAALLDATEGGVVAMPGVNGIGFLNYPNQPHIYCVSMTDAADNMRSRNGDHIDFAAPGDAMVSTTTGSGYAGGSGTSYATPVFAGAVAGLMSLNPALQPAEIIGILRDTADDLGAPGWDRFFGWGRIHFGRAAAAALATRPMILSAEHGSEGILVTSTHREGMADSLWVSDLLPPDWRLLSTTPRLTNAAGVLFVDPSPPAGRPRFYQVRAAAGGESSRSPIPKLQAGNRNREPMPGSAFQPQSTLSFRRSGEAFP